MTIPEISIVSGTYNRLSLLKDMVSSIRMSVGVGLPYEIILVDGGSTDGTIDWCKKQSDIKLIQQGKLLGAVKAFNEGCINAIGRYVILANDDITFVDKSIMRAYAFMEENHKCGIGCFFQNRYGRPWYVDRMPAVDEAGNKIWAYYGQVCIIPRWLGNKVGWWGDYLHTYAGDNEISCNILELGWQIRPIECSCISDRMHNDELRSINNPTPGNHTDSAKWVAKWTRGNKLGPRIKRDCTIAPLHLSGKLRFLYAPIYDTCSNLPRKTKHGLLDALKKDYIVQEVAFRDPGGIDELFEVADAFNPHIFLIQAHDADDLTVERMKELKRQHPNSIFLSWNGDYQAHNLFNPVYQELMSLFDKALFVEASIKDIMPNWGWWEIGYEEYEKKPLDDVPAYDVIFLGNEYSLHRTSMGHILREMNCKVGIYGSWKSIRPDGSNMYDFADADALYRKAKIVISDAQYPQCVGYVSNRLFQALYAGAFVLQQHINEMDEYVDITDGVHVATWDKIEDIPAKVDYWLSHPEERERIALAGHTKAVKDFSFTSRVKELNAIIKPILERRIALIHN